MKQLVLFYLLLLNSFVGAQTVLQNVQEAIKLARRNNPELLIARQNRMVQETQHVMARSGLLPQVRAFTNLDYNYALPTQLIPAEFLGGTPGEFRSIQFGVPFNLTAGVEVSAPILNHAGRLDIGLADQNLRISDDQNGVLQDEVAIQVNRVYYATLLTREAIGIARRNVANADTSVFLAQQRFDKGLIEPLELNRFLIVQLMSQDVLRQNELSYVRNLNQLKLLTGLKQKDSLMLDENLDTNQTAALLLASPEHERPQVVLRRSQLELNRLQFEREKALRWPTLFVVVRYSEQAQRKQFDFFDFNKKWYPIGIAGLQLNIPIFSGGLRLANLDRVRRRIQQAESELAYEQAKAEIDHQDVLNTYKQAVESLALNRRNYELSEENTRIALVKYRAGLFAYDQYLNVFNEALNAQNRYLSTLSTVVINQTILQIRSGK